MKTALLVAAFVASSFAFAKDDEARFAKADALQASHEVAVRDGAQTPVGGPLEFVKSLAATAAGADSTP